MALLMNEIQPRGNAMHEAEMAAKRAYAGEAMAQRETEVSMEIKRLTETAQQVHETALTLCNRLARVQRVGAPAPPGTISGQSVQPALCPLASEIRNIREAMEETGRMLDGNRNQLEI